MKGKRFIAVVLLIGLRSTLFGQPGQPTFVFSPTVIPDGLYGSPYTDQTLTVTGGMPPYSFSISSGGLPAGMTLSPGGILSGTPTAAGKYPFTVKAKDNSRGPGPHSGSQAYTLIVDPAVLTITANNASMTLGGPLPTLTVSYAGFVNGDNASSLTTKPTITTTAVSSSPAGTYPIAASGAKDPNYNFTYLPGTLTINGATVQVTANAQTKEYGTSDPTFTYVVGGVPRGDSAIKFTGSLSRTPGEDVGTYAITIGSLSAGRNYTISYTGNYLTITKATQQITWTQSLIVGCNATSHVQLIAAASSNMPVTYSVSDPSVAAVSGDVLTLLQPGTAVVTAVQAGNANYNAATAVTDTVIFQSTALITEHWNDVIFFDNSSGDYVGWQWYKNGVVVAGDTTPYYSETPSLNGQYYVMATNKDGQQVQSCTLTITPSAAVAGGIKVSPNPAGRGAAVTVICNYTGTTLQGAIVQISDISGRIVQQIKNVQPSMQVTMPSVSGIYIVSLILANGQRICTNVLIGE
jgi:hypothetical protein